MKGYDELLQHCQYEIIKFQNANSCTKVETKNFLENLRSILEYIAQEINQTLSMQTSKTYFPYADNEAKFINSVSRNLVNLKTEQPDVYYLIENIQSYKENDNWLTDLCNLTNEAKHKDLIETKETESKGIRIAGIINFKNVKSYIGKLTIDGKSYSNLNIDGDKLSYDNQDELELDFEVTNKKNIKFANNEYNVIEFLAKCTGNINRFVTEYKNIHKKYYS